MHTSYRFILGISLASLSLACLLAATPGTTGQSQTDGSSKRQPSPIERTVLIERQLLGRTGAPLVVAAKEGRGDAVRLLVEARGGAVVAALPEIDYLYLRVPFSAVSEVFASPDVAAVQVAMSSIRAEMSEDGAVNQQAIDQSVAATLGADNPYSTPFNVIGDPGYRLRASVRCIRARVIHRLRRVHRLDDSYRGLTDLSIAGRSTRRP